MRLAVVGAGSYGTCLAIHLASEGHAVKLWTRKSETALEITETRENKKYLPGFVLPETIEVTSSIKTAIHGCGIVVGVTPSHVVRDVYSEVASCIEDDVILVNASKGLEVGTNDRIDQIYQELFPAHVAKRATYLSGPTFAKEVAAHLPSAIALAGKDERACEIIQAVFSTPSFRVFTTDDVIGVLVGGALKNIYAICSGLSDGLGFGHNARAAIVTRGLAELSRLGRRLGADPMTFMGLSGMGDLVLTCAGDLSRNRRFGLELAKGRTSNEILQNSKHVAEGVKTSKVVKELSEQQNVEMPMARFIFEVIHENREARAGLTDLIGRALMKERD